MDIKGKVVLVTGASAGIGKATALLFGREGARVALAARSVDAMNKIASELKDSFVVGIDLSKPKAAREMVRRTQEHYGRLDVLINNAGQGYHVPIELVDVDDFAAEMGLNVYAPLVAMQAAIPIMRQQGGGAIVNISSMVTKNVYPSLAPYAATKCALNMLSMTAREELKKDGIIVSLVRPSLTDTRFRFNTIKSRAEFESTLGSLPAGDPPEKVAAVILEAVKTGAAELNLA